MSYHIKSGRAGHIENNEIRVLLIDRLREFCYKRISIPRQVNEPIMSGFFESLVRVPHIGEIFSLGAGLVWSFAVILFRVSGRTVHPLALNLFKNLFAAILVALTAAVLGLPLLPALGARPYAMMVLSGILGITISDTLFLVSLNMLGASLSAIVDCFYSPFIIGLSLLFLGERMSTLQLFGVALIVSAVLTITQKKHERTIPRRDLMLGTGLGTASMFTMAAGIVMIKPLLSSAPLLWAMFMRLAGASISLALVFVFHPKRREASPSPGPERELAAHGAGGVFGDLRQPDGLDGGHEIHVRFGRGRPQPAQLDLHLHPGRHLPQGKGHPLADPGDRTRFPGGLLGDGRIGTKIRPGPPRA